MTPRSFLQSSTLQFSAGIVLGVGGLLLIGIGLGTALDYLLAQSHPVTPMKAFFLGAEYTVAGILLLIAGGRIARNTSGTDGVTDAS